MKLQILLIPVILGIIGFYMCSYVVEETDQVILTQFGETVGEPVTEAGLHFKIPFIQEVNRIEKRFLPWDGPANEMSTKDRNLSDYRYLCSMENQRSHAVLSSLA